MDIRILPQHLGFGFSSREELPLTGYNYQKVGRYHNYLFTPEKMEWPVGSFIDYKPSPIIVDAFSPNVNKHLHVGHLRNLSLAKAYSELFAGENARFVALLGYSLGESAGAVEALHRWLDFVNYKPEIYRDIDIAEKLKLQTTAGTLEYTGCEVWAGLNGPVVVRRSDGTTTYAYHDLAFAEVISPTHYLTGLEQREHFENLGLGKKHLPMGLVLDPNTGKKMKSRDGTALSANDAMQLVIGNLDATPEPRKLAWNVLAWNFLRVNRSKDVKFNVEAWTSPESPGLYVTYTYARLLSALGSVPDPVKPDNETDFALLSFTKYLDYAKYCSQVTMDLAPIAEFIHDLARMVAGFYHQERIADGRPSFRYAVYQTTQTMKEAMRLLGLFPLESV